MRVTHGKFPNVYWRCLITACVLLASTSSSGQTRRAADARPKPANNNQTSGKTCGDLWSGTIEYSRTIRYAPAGTTIRDYNYKAQINVKRERASDKTHPVTYRIGNRTTYTSALQATNISIAVTDKDLRSLATGAGSKPGTFSVTVINNRYAFGYSLPDIEGILKLEGESRPKSFQGERFQVKDHPLDVADPDRLTGNITSQPKDANGFTENVRWDLKRCTPPVQIESVQFAQHRFPDSKVWVDIAPPDETVDGNQVRVTAKIKNNSVAPRTTTITFREANEGAELPASRKSVTVPGGGIVDVVYVWDTSGYAWTNDGKPQSERKIEVRIGDDLSSNSLNVRPKPVVLVHGLNSSAETWGQYTDFLRQAHSFVWFALPATGMNTGAGMLETAPTDSIFQNAKILGNFIKEKRQQHNAWHVDIVAHSMGGLISRQYIAQMPDDTPDKRPIIEHLVMLGTPNKGSACADLMRQIHGALDADVEAIRQLKPEVLAEFNQKVTDRKGVKFSILAGNPYPPNPACGMTEENDMVVPVSSAFWTIEDRQLTQTNHLNMTESLEDFKTFVLPRLAVGPKKAR